MRTIPSAFAPASLLFVFLLSFFTWQRDMTFSPTIGRPGQFEQAQDLFRRIQSAALATEYDMSPSGSLWQLSRNSNAFSVYLALVLIMSWPLTMAALAADRLRFSITAIPTWYAWRWKLPAAFLGIALAILLYKAASTNKSTTVMMFAMLCHVVAIAGCIIADKAKYRHHSLPQIKEPS